MIRQVFRTSAITHIAIADHLSVKLRFLLTQALDTADIVVKWRMAVCPLSVLEVLTCYIHAAAASAIAHSLVPYFTSQSVCAVRSVRLQNGLVLCLTALDPASCAHTRTYRSELTSG